MNTTRQPLLVRASMQQYVACGEAGDEPVRDPSRVVTEIPVTLAGAAS